MTVAIGDPVGYARPFLQSVTGGDPTNDMWHQRGKVVGEQGRFVQVLWDGDAEPTLVAPVNVAKVGSFAFAQADAKGWIGHPGLGEKPRSPWR